MLTAVVSGAVANTAHRGGDTWHRLHWMLGMRRLCVRVHLVEQISDATCVDANGARAPLAASENLAYFTEVLGAFDLADSATLLGSGPPCPLVRECPLCCLASSLYFDAVATARQPESRRTPDALCCLKDELGLKHHLNNGSS